MNGTVNRILLEKNFGFIRPANTRGEVFFHANDLRDGLEFDEQLQERAVVFDQVSDAGGRPRARNVRPER